MDHTPRPLQLLVAFAAACLTVAASARILAGWSLGVRELRALHPESVTMKSNTAVALGLAGAGLLLSGYLFGVHTVALPTVGLVLLMAVGACAAWVQVGRDVRVRVEGGAVRVELDAAVPLGLIANELASNALKHAFPEGRAGEVVVRVSQEGSRTSLVVEDDGVGLPGGFAVAGSRTLGLKLVEGLVKQLHGRLQTEPAARGARFVLTFGGVDGAPKGAEVAA